MNEEFEAQGNKQIRPSQNKELNIAAAIFGFVSGIVIALLQIVKFYYSDNSKFIDYLIPISPSISTILSAICINMYRQRNYNKYRYKIYDDIDVKYNRLEKELNKQIIYWEKRLKISGGNEERRELANNELRELEEEKKKIAKEKIIEMKKAHIPNLKPPKGLFDDRDRSNTEDPI